MEKEGEWCNNESNFSLRELHQSQRVCIRYPLLVRLEVNARQRLGRTHDPFQNTLTSVCEQVCV